MTERIKAAFDTVHADEDLKERTRDYLARSVYQGKRSSTPLRRMLPALAACLLLVFCLGGSWLYFTPTAYISVDINPSLELGVNRFDRVVSVDAYNEDGANLAETMELRYLDYRDALEQLMNDSSLEAYLQDGVLSLTVAGESESQCGEIYQAMEACASGRRNVRCHTGSSESIQAAHSYGMSVGKYQAYLALLGLDPDITPEEIQGMSMREIYQLIQSLAQERGNASPIIPDPSESGAGGGHGGGSGAGAGQGHGHRHGAQ